jgi:uncharacterized spore protein YtfJ
MTDRRWFEEVVEQLQRSASVKSVYGDPIMTDGKTIVPVARIAYGFGGGSGSNQSGQADASVATGAGGGGGVMATPVGVIEVTAAETRFVPIGTPWRIVAAAFGVGLGLGWLFGQRR